MKILYLTKYSRLGASSRMRSYQYFPYLEKAGFEVVVKPLFNDDYLNLLYSGGKSLWIVLKSYIRRFFLLFTVGKYDKIIIEKELFPYLPAWGEVILRIFNVDYIVDYDDAIFHNYDQSRHWLVRKLLGDKIGVVMKKSVLVIVGNKYLAKYAQKHGAKRIEIIPTVIDLERYPIKKVTNANRLVVGWIGTKSTFEKHLLPCQHWMKKIQHDFPNIEFRIVGITEEMDLGENVRYIPWTEETEVSEILKMDVGIMPLQDSPWEKGKCAYKLIQYAACGIPGIASDVGMNKEITIPEKTGYLASTDEDWIKHLLDLKNNPSKRQEMGENARKLVEENYCLQVTAKKWLNIL